MDKIKALQEKAKVLRALLEKYAPLDGDVEMVLRSMTPLLDEIEGGRVMPPRRDEFRWHFFNTESPLYLKYHDLSVAEAEYAEALEGWV